MYIRSDFNTRGCLSVGIDVSLVNFNKGNVMKVYATFAALPEPEFDWQNTKKYEQDCLDHTRRLKDYIFSMGYTGPCSGEIYREPMGDGYAQYMFVNAPRGSRLKEKSFLIHLNYWDGYDSQNVSFLPKAEILKRLKASIAFEKQWNRGS